MSDGFAKALECALTADADVFGDKDRPSPRRRLTRMAELVPRCVPQCCGAVVTLAADGDWASAASHPDLAELAEVQLRTGEGPIPQAMRTWTSAQVTDVLGEGGWPRYRAAALEAGVRSSVTLPFRCPGVTLTMTVYRFWPGPLRQSVEAPLALLGGLLATTVARDLRYEEALAAVDQMNTAVRSRPVVDQACGILMHATGCDADEAFGTLRRISQQSNQKLVTIARHVVETRGRGLRSRPAGS